MNEFIKLRQSNFDYENTYDFMQTYLKKDIHKESTSTTDKELFLKNLEKINHLNNDKQLDKSEYLELLSYLGQNSYIDRYTMDTIIGSYKNYPNNNLKDILEKEINNQTRSEAKIYHLLDLLLELDFDVLSRELMCRLLEEKKSNLDIVSILIEYAIHFKIKVSKEVLYKHLKNKYPNTIKLQILDLLVNLYSIDSLDLDLIKLEITTKSNSLFINDYIDFLKGKHKINQKGVVILQSMFYGDFEESGKGNNGGLAILLKNLGNEISIDSRIETVITITISGVMDKPFMAYYQDNHCFVRLPAYLDRGVADPFIKRELFIKRYIRNFLIKLNVEPDIFHIRYLDNASMAVAKLTKELNKKLVLTLAPDPHRNMVDEEGYLKLFNFDELQLLVNKIKLGDALILESDKILGIGKRRFSEELLLYFPQGNHFKTKHKIKMIAEGIKTDDDMFIKNEDVDVCKVSELIGIDESFCNKPIILNVGRLSLLKGQVALFKAWSSSKLNQSHNLLIIGGDLEKPTSEEQEVIDFFNQEIKKHPNLTKKFFHKGAIPNKKVKSVEKSIMKKSFDYPHIYLSSSLKEEFGIAILEAMSRGFLVLAPIRGGVKSYITNKKNGFLIDTSSYQTIAKDAERILYNSNINNEEFKLIQKSGKETIKTYFSIDKIAKSFTDTYLSLIGGKNYDL